MTRKPAPYLLFMAGLFFLLSKPVHAYIDPATTTYLIQILSALVITLGVTLGIFFNRIRSFFLNLRVVLNKFWIRITVRGKKGHGRPAPAARQTAKGSGMVSKSDFLWSDDRRHKNRFLAALFPCFCFFSTFLVFGIYELYAGNLDDFAFPVQRLLLPLILLALAASLLTALLFALIRGRVFDAILSLLLGVCLAVFIQAMLLNSSLGRLTGDTIAWETLSGSMAVNSLLWLLILLIPFLLRLLSRKTWWHAVHLLPLILVLSQLISSLSLYVGDPRLKKGFSSRYLSNQGLYEVADGHNIIVIILDRLDNRFIESVIRDQPDYFDRLDGFTRFTNNLSSYSQTFPSITHMLTGIPYDFQEGYTSYLERAWAEGRFIPDLKEAGFSSHLYLTPSQAYLDPQALSEHADNLTEGSLELEVKPAIQNFIRLSAYRYAPLALKPFYWTTTDEFTGLIQAKFEPAPYSLDDLSYYNGLLNHGLEVTGEGGNFIFLHLNGPHPPFIMNEKAEPVEEGQSSYLLQTKGSFHIIYEYLDQLKAMGQYEGATIIITGDHGARSSDVRPPDGAIVTGLFVKPAGKAGTPLESNSAPVSSEHFSATVYQAAGLDAHVDGPAYFDIGDHDYVPRYLHHRLYASEGNPARLLTFLILGDANLFDNWTLVAEEILD
ncbi:MAG: LTA synthase family protein [Clostridiaceae bacterium]|jgi:hypothetical protein|nr:LTA synthase family protein [Clostridiaceae bacterium]